MLFYFSGGAADGTPTTVLAKETGGATATVLPKGQPLYREGVLAQGGYLTAAPLDVYNVFYAGAGTEFHYFLASDPATGRINQLQVGIGKPGQIVHAGEELTYRFGVATLGGPLLEPAQYAAKLEDIGASFGFGGAGGVKATATVGKVLGEEAFLALDAQDHEACVKIEPRETIVDLPIRVAGIEDNGCAAVYSTARPWLRWVGVAEGQAWLQENVDRGSDIWAGNVFVCDNKAVKLTLITDGQAAGRKPFLEVHNPTDAAIRATVTSPPHTPLFGGMKLTVDVPAGSNSTVELRWK
jgi:hypothetical protein